MNLICGINPVLEALQAGTRQFDRLLVVKGLRNRRVSDAIARASQIGVPLRFETREALDRMAAGVPHQGIIAVVSPKPVMGMHDLLAVARDPALLVVLDGIEDPRNLGAILRTAEAAGADGVLLPERHSAGLSETVARASAGALEHVKVARIGNVSQALEELKKRNVWVIGLDANGGERWDKVDFRRPVALVLGGEGRGMRRLVRERCDQLVALPLFGHVDSLNVSVAAGAVLYEVVRQRGTVPSHVKPIPPSARPHAPQQITGPSADDDEDDPGRTLSGRAVPADSEDDDAEPKLSLVEIHEGEDAAWRVPESGPPGERRGPRPRPEGRKEPRESREAREPRPPREAREARDAREARPAGGERHRPPAEASGDSAAAADRDPERRRRRRRRRTGRPAGAPEANGNGPRVQGERVAQERSPHEPASQAAAAHERHGQDGERLAPPPNGGTERGAEDAPAAPVQGAPAGPDGAARRRRRRRRRH
jgi:23S rRNA (guanosine2251-2'-O)-methyltransferase